jgi:hypothetical protein
MQKLTLATIRECGGATFVVNDDESLRSLKKWLDLWTNAGEEMEDAE